MNIVVDTKHRSYHLLGSDQMSKNLNAFVCERHRRARWPHTLAAIVVGVFSGACGPPEQTTVTTPQGVQVYNADHTLIEQASQFCNGLSWTTCAKPEFTDDQAFMGADNQTYGPTAFIAPAENLNSHLSETAFQTAPVLVAYVLVPQSDVPLSSSYTDLRLGYGNHCVFLMHAGGQFKAYVVPAAAQTCDPYPTPLPQHELSVTAIASEVFSGHANIPPVARFHEGNKGALAGVAFLGMKCADRWCLVLPQAQGGENVGEWAPPHAGVHNNLKTWSVYGWNDSQHLAVPNSNGVGLKRSTMRASVVADTNLGNLTEADFADDWQHVATVYLTGGTSGKYKDTWNFRQGHNEVFIKKMNDTLWVGEIRRKRLIGWSVRQVKVHRRDHNVPIPSTARFMWTSTDEDLWIECDDGCCRVSGQ